jgi:hypothetical protein
VMSKKKYLPQYWDDEVRVFHPLFEDALNQTLSNMGLDDELEVIHHWSTKGFSGIIDFAICNKKSKKVLLPIEVKKTVVDLKAIGRKQARGYLESLGLFRGSDYYLATNLEYVELFRDTPNRVLTMAQLLNLSGSFVGDLKTSDYEGFIETLQNSLEQVLEAVRGNDGSDYASNISGLLHALETSVDDLESWHQAQAFYAFDYIRGALSSDAYFKKYVDEWKPANSFANLPSEMKGLVAKIDFDLLFEKLPSGRFNVNEISQISEGAFEAGRSEDLGEDLAGVVNEIAYLVKAIPGVVETTPNLADLLVAQLSMIIGPTLSENIKILEPGCGSGNLIVALKKHYENLTAKQIFGVEKQEIFREVLSLRLGLHFKDSLRNGERPDLSIRTLESISVSECEDVGLVIMNPPFIRGIDCVEERKKIADLIFKISNTKSMLTGKQLGYECGYLELLLNLVPEQTVIASIFPKNALLRPDSQELREYLIKDFGLKQIVLYKDNNLFGSVQKSTVILIGKKGSQSEKIEIFNHVENLENIDFQKFKVDSDRDQYIQKLGSRIEIETRTLLDSAEAGWKGLLGGVESEYKACLNQILDCSKFSTLGEIHKLTRGTIGNKGASDFLFNPKISSKDSQRKKPDKWHEIPSGWILPAVKNSDSVPREITKKFGDSAIHYPEGHRSEETEKSIFENYLRQNRDASKSKTNSGSQRKVEKSSEDLSKILEVSRPVHGPIVLIPRGQRVSAQISFSSEKELMVSTNFFIAECGTRAQAIILASWLLTLFGQLQLEHSGIDQEGMRKLEKFQIENCLIPQEINFTNHELVELEKVLLETDPLLFRAITPREIDEIWAKKLSPDNWIDLMASAESTLQVLCNQRLEI